MEPLNYQAVVNHVAVEVSWPRNMTQLSAPLVRVVNVRTVLFTRGAAGFRQTENTTVAKPTGIGGGTISVADTSGASGGGGDLRLGVGALEKFQKRVDTILSELEGGAAGSTKMAAQRIARSSLSGTNAPFAEADGLHRQYSRVHEELVSLSKSLGEQITMLRIAVRGTEIGFENLEEEHRVRFHAISDRLLKEREQAMAERSGAADKQQADTSSGDFGLEDS